MEALEHTDIHMRRWNVGKKLMEALSVLIFICVSGMWWMKLMEAFKRTDIHMCEVLDELLEER